MQKIDDQTFQVEVLDMLKPKIKSILSQTHYQNRDDLEQEVSLMIIKKIKENTHPALPSIFELLEAERALETETSL
ncbi:hypothetical protein M3152_13465 [Sporosarcina luteola]|uniref:hypothetical protein n=1 Tax=Bacillales TaxID=1385 RepID=UPI00203AB293|nr:MULTISPECIES: hypothetical protein [Bacillales]MCM3638709.1 hypothetical protein [Sporosarcina luteola]